MVSTEECRLSEWVTPSVLSCPLLGGVHRECKLAQSSQNSCVFMSFIWNHSVCHCIDGSMPSDSTHESHKATWFTSCCLFESRPVSWWCCCPCKLSNSACQRSWGACIHSAQDKRRPSDRGWSSLARSSTCSTQYSLFKATIPHNIQSLNHQYLLNSRCSAWSCGANVWCGWSLVVVEGTYTAWGAQVVSFRRSIAPARQWACLYRSCFKGTVSASMTTSITVEANNISYEWVVAQINVTNSGLGLQERGQWRIQFVVL